MLRDRPSNRVVAAVLLGLLFGVAPAGLAGREIHVGRDAEALTIAQAIKLARPGDTIHLEPNKVYYDYAGFYGKKGEPGRPVTLDGHGAILDGSDPLNPADWREVSPGLFANSRLLPRLDDAILSRWFFLWNGQVTRMGRASKAKSTELKTPESLEPGEWTFVRDASQERPDSKQIFGTFYLRLPSGRTLADELIRAPVRSAGVQFSGDNAHLVIRNVTARYPYNDGFNIHGDCRDVVFENITAIGCGDDGISAHESAQYRVHGFTSIGNSTGICDTGTAQTSYERVFIADCVSVDLYFLDEGRYSLKDVVVFSSAQRPFLVTGRAEGDCRLTMENVYFHRRAEPRVGQITTRAAVEGNRCTFRDLDLQVTGEARWANCLLNGKPSGESGAGADFDSLVGLVPESHR